jgi:hypothetical protein
MVLMMLVRTILETAKESSMTPQHHCHLAPSQSIMTRCAEEEKSPAWWD